MYACIDQSTHFKKELNKKLCTNLSAVVLPNANCSMLVIKAQYHIENNEYTERDRQGQIDRWMDGWADSHRGRQIDGWMDGWRLQLQT